MTVSNFGDFYNGALKVFETVCLRTSAHPTMCANDILLQTRNTSDDDDDLFNQPLLVYISASRSLIDEPKRRNFIKIQFFSCPGSSIPDLGQSVTDWVGECHFRILTQRVTFETSDPSDI